MKTFKLIEKQSELFTEALLACEDILHNSAIAEDARNYLNKRLSIAAQKKYGFGFFPSDEHLHHITSLIDKKYLKKLNLVYPKYISGGSKDHGHFNNHNLIMPFKDVYGNVVSVLGRTLVSDEALKELQLQKYKYTLDSKKDLYVYGLNYAKDAIIKNNCVICVEGQFDCISCYENGIDNVIALGWANMTKYQFFSLHRYTDNFILLLDNDDAGKRARVKISNKFSPYANFIKPKVPGHFKDIDECLRKDDHKAAVVDWLKCNCNISIKERDDG